MTLVHSLIVIDYVGLNKIHITVCEGGKGKKKEQRKKKKTSESQKLFNAEN